MLKKIEKINGENGKFALVKYTSLEKCNNKTNAVVEEYNKTRIYKYTAANKRKEVK